MNAQIFIIKLVVLGIISTSWHAFGPLAEAVAKPETRTYRVTFNFANEVVAQGCRTMKILDPKDNVAHMTFDRSLDLAPIIDHLAEFAKCFPDGALVDGLHGIFRDSNDPERIDGTLFFPGLDKRGKAITYRLDFSGTVVAQQWTPAAVGDSATVQLHTWTLKADTGGRKNSCGGEGLFSVGDTILVKRLSSCE